MSNRPTDAQIITRALELMRAGILASNIPARLMEEYGLTSDRARELAARAIERRRIETQKPG